MSHYSLAVITKDPIDTAALDELLCPFSENVDEVPIENLVFYSTEEEHKKTYEKASEKFFREIATGKIFTDIREAHSLFIEVSEEVFDSEEHKNAPQKYEEYISKTRTYRYMIPDLSRIEWVAIPLSKVFPTFDDYMLYLGEEKDEDTGEYGYYFNPNAKWDWWSIGGRFANDNIDNSILIKDLLQIPINPERYKSAERFWELAVEGQPLKPGEERLFSYKPEYYTERYSSKEDFAQKVCKFETFAVLTPDRQWHEQGSMGWFGCSDETAEEAAFWSDNYAAMFLLPYEDCWLTLVDCHT